MFPATVVPSFIGVWILPVVGIEYDAFSDSSLATFSENFSVQLGKIG